MASAITINAAKVRMPGHRASSTTCQFRISSPTAPSAIAMPASPIRRAAVQAATLGRTRRTTMPATSGRKKDPARTTAVRSGASDGSRGNSGPSNASHRGTSTTASTEEITTRLKI